jgi:hypothetical protein
MRGTDAWSREAWLDQGAGTAIRVHVCVAHTIVNAVGSVARGAVPIVESTEEGAQALALVEAASPQKAGVPLPLRRTGTGQRHPG